MATGIKRKLKRAAARVRREIAGTAAHSKLAGALAGEGYTGGYWDALQDVMLALNGVTPHRNGWWDEPAEAPRP